MDPLECLIRLDQQISDLRLVDATASLADYRAWRRTGGFEPYVHSAEKRGDVFAANCERRLIDCKMQDNML